MICVASETPQGPSQKRRPAVVKSLATRHLGLIEETVSQLWEPLGLWRIGWEEAVSIASEGLVSAAVGFPAVGRRSDAAFRQYAYAAIRRRFGSHFRATGRRAARGADEPLVIEPELCETGADRDDLIELATALEALPEVQRRLIELRFGLNGQPPLDVKSRALAVRISLRRLRSAETAALSSLRTLLSATLPPRS